MTSWKRGSFATSRPDLEVHPKAERRQFSSAEKLRIVEEADRSTQPGQIGALLQALKRSTNAQADALAELFGLDG